MVHYAALGSLRLVCISSIKVNFHANTRKRLRKDYMHFIPKWPRKQSFLRHFVSVV